MFQDKRTPDQIRRETVPFSHTGLIYGILGGAVLAMLTFCVWGLFHIPQIKHYPEFFASGLRSAAGKYSPFRPSGFTRGIRACMTADELRYSLLRYGNIEHRLDADIICLGWYPKGANPRTWVVQHGAIEPLYSDSPLMIFSWPLTLSLFAFLSCGIAGLMSDYRYRQKVIAGIPFDGTIVATVEEYNREVKGAGMRYGVYPWQDR